MCPICTNALQRKRPMPCGEIAKLHSLVRSNSAACLSFITARASAIVCWPVSGCGDTLVTLPSTLIAGGKSAVRNRSEPLREIIRRSRSLTNFEAWSRSMVVFSRAPPASSRAGQQRAQARAGLPQAQRQAARQRTPAAPRPGAARLSSCGPAHAPRARPPRKASACGTTRSACRRRAATSRPASRPRGPRPGGRGRPKAARGRPRSCPRARSAGSRPARPAR